ncbi:unnamed protein product, partial [Musa textilis]
CFCSFHVIYFAACARVPLKFVGACILYPTMTRVLARSLQPWRNMEDWCRLRKTLLNLACV